MSTPRDKVLRVDLSSGQVSHERIPAGWRSRYVGGKGLAARYLIGELPPGTDPLSAANVLCLAIGPVTGLLPGEQRYAVITKSPLSGAFLDAYAGGDVPGAIAGALPEHLMILITGQADEPMSLTVADGSATLSTSSRWGESTKTVCDGEAGPVACIGPAGESQVAYATIASTPGAEHHAGRGGAGAVMGSKRLKSIVVEGSPPESLQELRATYTERYRQSPTGRWLAASGTVESVEVANATGVLAARGWSERGTDAASELGIAGVKRQATGREHAPSAEATGPGGFRVPTPDGESVPRGATAMSLGAGLSLDSFEAAAELGALCNGLGLDLISAGSAVAWAIRAAEENVITPEAELAFGDPSGARRLLERIARRADPLADRLADGVDAATAAYGGESLIPTAKGMELPAYDPRGSASMALAYATADRGGCHRRARPVEREPFEGPYGAERAAKEVALAQNTRSLRWSLVADDFVGEILDAETSRWLKAVGAPTDGLDGVGERIWNLVRLFNVREGFDRSDDSITGPIDPERLSVPLERMLDAYYERRGWTDNGVPTAATLERLSLTEI